MFGFRRLRVFEQVLPQVRQRTLADTGQLQMCEALFEVDAHVPPHVHPQDQITFVAEGHVRVRVGEDVAELDAGDCYAIPGAVEHEIWALGRARVVDVFTPHRPEYALEKYVVEEDA